MSHKIVELFYPADEDFEIAEGKKILDPNKDYNEGTKGADRQNFTKSKTLKYMNKKTVKADDGDF